MKVGIAYSTLDDSRRAGRMVAEEAYDAWGWDVEYRFERVSDQNGDGIYEIVHSSGWLNFGDDVIPEWIDGGLVQGQEYTYRFKTRDVPLGGMITPNQTEYSVLRSAIADADTTPPNPDPAEWGLEPVSIGAGATSIEMRAIAATDPQGNDVEYFFECIDDGHNSGWQAERYWLDTGLTIDQMYTYRFRARDLSANFNMTGWSVLRSAVAGEEPPPVDNEPPTPNPARWEIFPYTWGPIDGLYYHVMQAEVHDDASGYVEYRFVGHDGGPSSGWQIEVDYVTQVVGPNIPYSYHIEVRDLYGNTTAPSTTCIADHPCTDY